MFYSIVRSLWCCSHVDWCCLDSRGPSVVFFSCGLEDWRESKSVWVSSCLPFLSEISKINFLGLLRVFMDHMLMGIEGIYGMN
jgi:hypothetical protein